MNFDELLLTPNGARFYRADMHIHSFVGSHDVRDTTMTPQAIVETAIAEKLDVIAITDHNEIKNIELALNTALGTELLVIPGIELSTPQGHLLCYFPDFDSLNKFFGRITVVERDQPNSRCQNAILDCLNILDQLNGFAILAHVDTDSGYEHENPSNSPHKIDVLCHKSLLGIELKTATSDIFYSNLDTDPNRISIGNERIKRLNLGSKQYFARVLNSDAHTLNALGRNANGDKKVTRIKMDKPSFSALRIALEDSDARVRIEDLILNEIPHVACIKLEGGFLDGQEIHFSRNLNCIIGGRGTGKSSTFEAIKCLTGNNSENSVVDSEIWPNNIFLSWCDQAGQYHTLERPIGGFVSNLSFPGTGPTSFNIECYGQGETERISKEAQSNPIALLSYLDRFIDIDELQEAETTERNMISSIQTQIEKAYKNVQMIPQFERLLAVTQQQLGALEKAKAKEIIELSRKLAQEREIRLQITDKLKDIKSGIDDLSAKKVIEQIVTLADPTTLTIGGTEFGNIITSSRQFEAEALSAQTTLNDGYIQLEQSINQQISIWKEKERSSQTIIENKKKELQALNIPLDMIYIQKLATDEAKYKADHEKAKAWKPYLEQQKKLYRESTKKRWNIRERIAMTRQAFAKEASATLKSVLTDLIVSLKYGRSAFSPSAEEQIKTSMNWRNFQVSRAGILIEQLSLPGLLKAIDNKDYATIMSVVTPEKTQIFNRSEADRIIAQLSTPQIRFALELCEVYDLPHLIVNKAVKNPDGTTNYASRDFSKLSLGQQQSVLLALLLSSKSNVPLIIDQPEDNLDGEFIYHSLVPVLRLAKERRQIIVVTHNANIAVLGDAEQILVLKSTNEKGLIVSRGSIDDLPTREIACNILEGAKEAFQRRAKMYGLNIK